MKRKISKLLMMLIVCLMAFPCMVWATDSFIPSPAPHTPDKAATMLSLPLNGDLYSNQSVNNPSSFTSSEFAGTDSTNIRVWFDNQGNDGVKVKLYKETKNGSKKVGSFSVGIGTNSSKEFKGKKGTVYYIVVDSDYGGTVKGYLRARQLNSSDEADVPSHQSK